MRFQEQPIGGIMLLHAKHMAGLANILYRVPLPSISFRSRRKPVSPFSSAVWWGDTHAALLGSGPTAIPHNAYGRVNPKLYSFVHLYWLFVR
jgi:hypothetical protein